MPKRINHIGKIVTTLIRKPQFCKGYVKSSKTDSSRGARSLFADGCNVNKASALCCIHAP